MKRRAQALSENDLPPNKKRFHSGVIGDSNAADTSIQKSFDSNHPTGVHSWTTLAKKKWITATRPDTSSTGNHGVDLSKRNTFAATLDSKKLFEFLNSTEDQSLELALAAFDYKIEMDFTKREVNEEEIKPENEVGRSQSLLYNYLEQSPECHELWTIFGICIKKDKTKTTLGSLVVQVFASIIKFNAFAEFAHINSAIARRMIKSHIHVLGSMLSSDQAMHANATLNLLTSIASINVYHARDLFSAFNWSQKSFFTLVNKKNATYEGRKELKQKQQAVGETDKYQNLYLLDVRTQYIRFGLSFLGHDDAPLSQDVLAVTGFMNTIFKDMLHDATALILQVFEVLHENVVANKSISKQSKIAFFNHRILEQIYVIYKRFTLLPDRSTTLAALASLTRRRIQSFLESLLTSPSEGIIFPDHPKPFPPSSGLAMGDSELALISGSAVAATSVSKSTPASNQHWMGRTSRNRHILKFIQLLQPQDSNWHQKLILKILKLDCQLKREYYESLKISIEPRPTIQWLHNVSYLIKLLDQRPLDLDIIMLALNEHQSASSAGHSSSNQVTIDRILGWFIPSSCLQRSFLSTGLRHPNSSVRHLTISLIHRMTNVLEWLMQSIDAELGPVSSNAFTPNSTPLLYQFKEAVNVALRRKIPDADTVLTLYTNMATEESFSTPDSQAASKATSSSSKPITNSATSQANTDSNKKDELNIETDPSLLRSHILSLFASYISLFPETFSELNFDYSKIFMLKEVWFQPLRVQEGFLELLEASERHLKWSGKINKPKAGGSKNQDSTSDLASMTQLEYLLNMLMCSKDQSLRPRTTKVLEKLLLASGLFEQCNQEIGYWLSSVAENPHHTVATYIRILLTLVSSSPYPYLELMQKFVEASFDPDKQVAWALPPFHSNASLAFSIPMMYLLVSHANTTVQLCGGEENASSIIQHSSKFTTSTGSSISHEAQLLQVSNFVITLILKVLYASESPLPLLLAIEQATQSSFSPSSLVPTLTNMPSLCKDIKNSIIHKHRYFGSFATALNSLLHQLFSIASAVPVIPKISKPEMTPRDHSIQNLHISIFSQPDHVTEFDFLPSAGLVLSHLMLSPQRHLICQEPSIHHRMFKMILSHSDPSFMLESVEALLFHIGILLNSDSTGDCLKFCMSLLSSLFFHSLDSTSLNSSQSMGVMDTDEPAQVVPSLALKALSEAKQSADYSLSKSIFRRIMSNYSLNNHFLSDLKSQRSVDVSHLIIQFISSVITRSNEVILLELKNLASSLLSKVETIFSQAIGIADNYTTASFCAQLVLPITQFLPSHTHQKIAMSIVSLGSNQLVKPECTQILSFLLRLYLPASTSTISTPGSIFVQVPENENQEIITQRSEEEIFSAIDLIQSGCVEDGELKVGARPFGFTAPIIPVKIFKVLVDVLEKVHKTDRKDHQMEEDNENSFNDEHALVPLLCDVLTRAVIASNLSMPPLKTSEHILSHIEPECRVFSDYKSFFNEKTAKQLFRNLVQQPLTSFWNLELSQQLGNYFGLQYSVPNLQRALLYANVASPARIAKSLKDLELESNIQSSSSWTQSYILNTFQASQYEELQDQFLHELQLTKHCMWPLVLTRVSPIKLLSNHLFYTLAYAYTLLEPMIISAGLLQQVEFGPLLRIVRDFALPLYYASTDSRSLTSSQITQICSKLDYTMLPNLLKGILSAKCPETTKLCFQQAALISKEFQLNPLLQDLDPIKYSLLNRSEDMVFEYLNKEEIVVTFHSLPLENLLSITRKLLRYGFERIHVLKWIRNIVTSGWSQSSAKVRADFIASLHDLLISHSSFAKLLFGSSDSKSQQSSKNDQGENEETNQETISKNPEQSERFLLLQCLAVLYRDELETTKYSDKMMRLYMTCYGATLSPCDQMLLSILSSFESHGTTFAMGGFLWGQSAQEFQSTTAKPSDNQTDKMEVDNSKSATTTIDIVTLQSMLLSGKLINFKKLHYTSKNFPVKLKMEQTATFSVGLQLWPWKTSSQADYLMESIYDPRFLLRMYVFGLNNFRDFDSKKFVDCGGLHFILQALSSEDTQIVTLGYVGLTNFIKLLDNGPHVMREAIYVRLLLNVLRASVETENQRIPSIITSFLGEASQILIRMDHPLFLEIHNYLNSRPMLDITSVPIVLRFLHSPRTSAQLEREWILRILDNGMRSPSELALLGLRAPNWNDNMALHLEQVSTSKGGKTQLLPMLLTHMSSVPASIYSASTERYHLWNIIRNIIILDAPFYKNSLTGPTGILGFLADWTSSHHLHSNGIICIPAANAPSIYVYAEMVPILDTIANLPELEMGICRSVAPLILPVIGNILQFLELSYCRSSLTYTPHSFGHSDPSSFSISKNPYFKLLSPCITILHKLSLGLPSASLISSHYVLTCSKLLRECSRGFTAEHTTVRSLKMQLAQTALICCNLECPENRGIMEVNLLRYAISALLKSPPKESFQDSIASLICQMATNISKQNSLLFKVLVKSFEDDSGLSDDLLACILALARRIHKHSQPSVHLAMTYFFSFFLLNYKDYTTFSEKSAKRGTWCEFFQEKLPEVLTYMQIPQPLSLPNIDSFVKSNATSIHDAMFEIGLAWCTQKPLLKQKIPKSVLTYIESLDH